MRRVISRCVPAWLRRLIQRRLEPMPVPVRFSDGRLRLSTVRILLLSRLWLSRLPTLVNESRQSLAAYDGGDVLDIGAFHGWYSILLGPRARDGDSIISFEPDPDALPVLRTMLRDVRACLPGPTFELVAEPLGDGGSVVASWPLGSGGHPSFTRAAGTQSRPSLTADRAVEERGLKPRFVKVDVEGAEWFVLQGMLNTLRLHRPTVMLEVHPTIQPPGIDAGQVEALMREHDYSGVVLDDSATARRWLWTPA